jgi:hypothetical protein
VLPEDFAIRIQHPIQRFPEIEDDDWRAFSTQMCLSGGRMTRDYLPQMRSSLLVNPS